MRPDEYALNTLQTTVRQTAVKRQHTQVRRSTSLPVQGRRRRQPRDKFPALPIYGFGTGDPKRQVCSHPERPTPP